MEKRQKIKLFCLEVQKLCALTRLQMEKNKRKRRFAVRKLLLERRRKGYFHSLIPEMRLNDVECFVNFHRMCPKDFDDLLHILGPNLKNTPIRAEEAITVGERLSITLRYLASGDSMKSIGFYGFRIGASTTSNIIRETCEAIWEKLQFVFPSPSEGMWSNISDDFYSQWGFPNCLGAIDGKHVIVQAFPNSNSLTFNYKHTHSLVLMAVADAHYKFSVVDIGALGHNSDGAVFRNSKFGKNVLYEPELIKIPSPKQLPNTNDVAPFVFLADEAFPLRKHIMRPYPGQNTTVLPDEQTIFNKNLSKARRVVENAFGILASRFRIYRKPIIASKETSINIVKATICLHNWLQGKNRIFSLENQTEDRISRNALESIKSSMQNRASAEAIEVREIYTNYFKNLV